MNLRQRRLADEIQRVVGACFQADQMGDPRLRGVTITHVKITADLQLASLYYRVFETGSIDGAADGLRHCKSFLRRQIATHLELRRVPDLRFFHDEAVEVGARIEALLATVEDDFAKSSEKKEHALADDEHLLPKT